MTEIRQAQTLPVPSALLTVVALAHAAAMLLMLLLCNTLHMHITLNNALETYSILCPTSDC